MHDQGPEFKGQMFLRVLENCGVENHPTAVKNPRANSICERMHQTVGNVLRTMTHANPPQDMSQASDMMDSCLATAVHAARASASRALGGISPGGPVFQRDVFLDVPLVADVVALTNQREVLVNKSLRKANLGCHSCDHQVNERVSV